MSFADDRWSDKGKACADCGRSLRWAYCPTDGRCASCARNEAPAVTPDLPMEQPTGSIYPVARLTPEQIAEWQAEVDAFDAALMEDAFIFDEEEEREREMPIIAKESGSNFKPAPAGTSAAVCCDVVDLGMQKTSYPGTPDKMQHKIRVVWQLADIDPSIGKRPVVSQRYTLSLHEKASLRRDLQSWRGRTFTPAELAGFDVEKVIGAPVLLNIVHSADGQYANVAAIMPLPKGMAVPAVEGYVRDRDRPKVQPEPPEGDHDTHEDHEGNEPFQATDEMVPFAVVLPFLAGLVGLGAFIA